jgi:hypothetical protein
VKLKLVLWVLALLMLGLILLPAELWRAPAVDASYRGFDSTLVYSSAGGSGLVRVSRTAIDLEAPPTSKPAVLLATTPIQKFNTSVDVTVEENQNAGIPLQLGIWTPLTQAGFFVVFGPDNSIAAETELNGSSGVAMRGGQVITRTDLGTYQAGKRYQVEFALDKAAGTLTTRVAGDGSAPAVASVTAQQFPRLFADVALSLSASSEAGDGSSRIVLSGFAVDVPHQRLWASKIDDPRAQALLIVLGLGGALLLVVAIVRRRSDLWGVLRVRSRAIGFRGIALFTGAAIVYLAGNALLFPLGGHPFDMRAEQLYAYVAQTYGLSQLYFLPNVVSVPKLWDGVPIEEFAFPYQPVLAYLSGGIGWLNSALTGGRSVVFDSTPLQYLIKTVNVLFGLADGVLIYWILRRIGTGLRWSLIAAALWLFNPAVWFSMSVWGQTHVISLCFVLVAVLLIEMRQPLGAWLALIAACLTRPQMLVFGLLLGIVLLRKFSWNENAMALSWAVIVTFLSVLPLTLATSPSLPVDILINTFRAHEGGAPGLVSFVSQDAYSVWPLVEYLTQGVTGFHQAFNPSSGVILGPLTFQRLSQLLTLLALLIVSAYLWIRRSATEEAGAYLPYIALGVTAFLMLLFALIATHFLLALPLLLLCRRWTGGVAFIYLVVIWTVTTFVTMYGDMGLVLSTRDYPLLAYSNNAVTRFVVWLYREDRFITAGIVANICAVVWLAYLTLRSTKGQLSVNGKLTYES